MTTTDENSYVKSGGQIEPLNYNQSKITLFEKALITITGSYILDVIGLLVIFGTYDILPNAGIWYSIMLGICIAIIETVFYRVLYASYLNSQEIKERLIYLTFPFIHFIGLFLLSLPIVAGTTIYMVLSILIIGEVFVGIPHFVIRILQVSFKYTQTSDIYDKFNPQQAF